jgi:hypothetical protein
MSRGVVAFFLGPLQHSDLLLDILLIRGLCIDAKDCMAGTRMAQNWGTKGATLRVTIHEFGHG